MSDLDVYTSGLNNRNPLLTMDFNPLYLAGFILNAIATAIGVFLYMQRREDHVMKTINDVKAQLESKQHDTEELVNEVRMNYLKRFELLTDKLNEIKIEVVKEIGELKLLIQTKA